MLSARVYGRGKFGQEYDHMVLTVNLGEEWLVDVGFGDNFLEPIRIDVGSIQDDPAGYFKIEEHDAIYRRLESSKDGLSFSPNYIFTQIERQLGDYVEMCAYHQTSPESSFTQERVCTIAIEDGRITMRDQNLIETVNDHKTVRQVIDEEEYNQILGDRFGIYIR
jgi:N-hydroxyarylamine O-acetyltransferase